MVGKALALIAWLYFAYKDAYGELFELDRILAWLA